MYFHLKAFSLDLLQSNLALLQNHAQEFYLFEDTTRPFQNSPSLQALNWTIELISADQCLGQTQAEL